MARARDTRPGLASSGPAPAPRNHITGWPASGRILRVAGEAPFEIVRQKIIDVTPTLEQPMASAAEQLIQRGKREGRQEGLETGRLQALRQTLAQLLRSRFGRLDAATEERIANAAAQALDRWLARILTAKNVEDVFAAD
jgi:flagellar biosynthesis/type III secretory pathway protein FliH